MKPEKGFTLIEVIVTIVIITMATLAVFTFLRGSVTRSGESVALVQNLAEARVPMEEITAEYYSYLTTTGTGGNATSAWNSFSTYLDSRDGVEGIEVADFSPAANATDFAMKEVTITRGRHTISALFSE